MKPYNHKSPKAFEALGFTEKEFDGFNETFHEAITKDKLISEVTEEVESKIPARALAFALIQATEMLTKQQEQLEIMQRETGATIKHFGDEK